METACTQPRVEVLGEGHLFICHELGFGLGLGIARLEEACLGLVADKDFFGSCKQDDLGVIRGCDDNIGRVVQCSLSHHIVDCIVIQPKSSGTVGCYPALNPAWFPLLVLDVRHM